MTCQECELLLAQGEPDGFVGAHLQECASCRALSLDLAANSAVLESLKSEELPPISVAVPRRRWFLAAAAAAALLAALLSYPTADRIVSEPQVEVPRPQKEPLKIKMLTPDPDVVIYWLIDN